LFTFALKYDGKLPADRMDKARAPEKNRIRHWFHRQLTTYWSSQPTLRFWASLSMPEGAVDERQRGMVLSSDNPLLEHQGFYKGRLGRFAFLPLVTRRNGRECDVKVALLRPGRAHSLVTSGDLDNRIKTLFDCLRMPLKEEELEGLAAHHLNYDEPFYSVLEDDSLIGSFSVETAELLVPDVPPDDVSVTIKVAISRPIGA